MCVDVIKILSLESNNFKYTTKSKAFGDNSGTLNVAKCSRMTSGSKSISFKYPWLHENIHNGEYTVEKIAGDIQNADIFTKGIQGEIFLKTRKLLCGW